MPPPIWPAHLVNFCRHHRCITRGAEEIQMHRVAGDRLGIMRRRAPEGSGGEGVVFIEAPSSGA